MRKTILIADDDKDLVFVLRERFESVGFKTLVAHEGIRAIEFAHRYQPDVILLDWKMPAGMGSSVLENLKGHDDTKHIPVIVFTGVEDDSIEKMAMDLGAKGFYKKPCNVQKLIKDINEILTWGEIEESISEDTIL